MLCAGNQFSGACNGDSGGPLVCQEVSTNTWQLAGLVSWGKLGCDPSKGLPSVFARITEGMPWIDTVISGDEHLIASFTDSSRHNELKRVPTVPRGVLPSVEPPG